LQGGDAADGDEEMDITIATSKTKSGKAVQVAIIPSDLVMGDGPERMHWLATAAAQARGCTHYRVVGSNGQLVATGKAGALPTQEQTARTHGDGSDWSR
jgi:hypothetical protein